jgi:hypothetical protein
MSVSCRRLVSRGIIAAFRGADNMWRFGGGGDRYFQLESPCHAERRRVDAIRRRIVAGRDT